jgi:sugar phosphate permease
MLFFSSSTILGYLFSYTLVGRIVIVLGWKMAFFIPGVILMLSAGIWFVFYRQPAIRRDENVPGGDRADTGGRKNGPPCSGVLDFFIRTRLWVAALACMMEGSLKEGLTLWGPTFFSGFQKLPLDRTLFLMSLVPLMNCAGLVAGGIVYRRFRRQEKHTVALFMAAALVFAVLLRMAAGVNFILMDIAFFGLLAAIFATNNILTAFMPLKFQKERRISTAAGSLDCAVYIGAAVSGPLAGFLADTSGWTGIMNSWIGVCGIAVLCAVFFRNYKRS